MKGKELHINGNKENWLYNIWIEGRRHGINFKVYEGRKKSFKLGIKEMDSVIDKERKKGKKLNINLKGNYWCILHKIMYKSLNFYQGKIIHIFIISY